LYNPCAPQRLRVPPAKRARSALLFRQARKERSHAACSCGAILRIYWHVLVERDAAARFSAFDRCFSPRAASARLCLISLICSHTFSAIDNIGGDYSFFFSAPSLLLRDRDADIADML